MALRQPPWMVVPHAFLAQAFLAVIASIAALTAPSLAVPGLAAGTKRASVPGARIFQRGFLALAALTFCQLLLGASFRHANADAALYAHAGLALLLVSLTAWLATRALGLLQSEPGLARATALQGGLLMFQVFLGFLAWIFRRAKGGGGRSSDRDPRVPDGARRRGGAPPCRIRGPRLAIASAPRRGPRAGAENRVARDRPRPHGDAVTLEANLPTEAARPIRLVVSSYLELGKLRISTMVALTTAAGFDLAPRPARLEALSRDRHRNDARRERGEGAEPGRRARARLADAADRAPPDPNETNLGGEATIFALAAAILGIAILWGFVNPLTAALSAGCLLFYVGVYTPLKTRTTWNTLVGAVAGAVPPMLGWTGATGELGLPAWVLFGILVFWQLPHFFAIASIYRDDYAAAGFRMLPVVDERGANTAAQTLGFTAALIAISVAPYAMGISGPVYLAGALAFGLAFFWFAFRMVRARGARPEARRVLFASIVYLPCVLGLMVLDKTGA